MRLRRTFLRSLSAVIVSANHASGQRPDRPRARWGRVRLIEHVTASLGRLVDDVVVVARSAARLEVLPRRGVRVVKDGGPARGLSSVLAGLSHCRHPAAFVCAADMPLIEPDLVAVLAEAGAGYEAAVPRWEGRLQPLCAVYSRRVLGVLGRMAAEGEGTLEDLFEIVPTRFLLEDEVRAVDPKGRSFCGVDLPPGRRRLGLEGG